jgi:hypothetical protein
MHPLTSQQIRASFVNASRREVAQATLPDLDAARWDRLDLLGWRDRRAPLSAYVVLELDDEPVGVLLRSSDAPRRRARAVCAWCEDVIATQDVALHVARRGGAVGRRGDTIGTLICTDLVCSRNVRRRPTLAEAGVDCDEARALVVEQRVAGLRERSQRFVREVLRTR